jgi:hypothetical protein
MQALTEGRAPVWGSEFTTNYLRQTASGAAGIGLGATIKYLLCKTSVCAAAGNGLGTTIEYLRYTTSGAAGNDRKMMRKMNS